MANQGPKAPKESKVELAEQQKLIPEKSQANSSNIQAPNVQPVGNSNSKAGTTAKSTNKVAPQANSASKSTKPTQPSKPKSFEKNQPQFTLEEFLKTTCDLKNHNVFHRAARIHSKDIYDTLYLDFSSFTLNDVKDASTCSRSNEGVTPLCLACMFKNNDQPDLLKKRNDFILEMLKKKPEPNFCNFETGWRPINWLAAHGDNDLIGKLLEANAVSFLSDYKNGYFPVDVAGLNGHGATVAILINDYLKHIKLLHQSDQNVIKMTETSDNVKKMFQTPKGLFKDKGLTEKDYHLEASYTLASPILATNMLYWASKFKNIPASTVSELLKLTEAYPEGPVDIEMGFTPIHAAAYSGSPDKLEFLLKDYQNVALRVETGTAKNSKKRRRPWDNVAQNIMTTAQTNYETKVLVSKKHKALKKFSTDIFWPKIKKMQRTNKNNVYDLEAYEFETPLHMAAHKKNGEGQVKVTQMLMSNNYARTKDLTKGAHSTFDKKDSYGVMPKDFGQWNEQIKKEFEKYMEKLYDMPQDGEGSAAIIETNASGEDLEMNPKAKGSAQKAITGEPKDASGLKFESQTSVQNTVTKGMKFPAIKTAPGQPDVVLKLTHDGTKKSSQQMNHMISLLDKSEFDFKIFKSVQKRTHNYCNIFYKCFKCCKFCKRFAPKDVYYVMLSLSEGEIEVNAERLGYRHPKYYRGGEMSKFTCAEQDQFKPFMTKDIQAIIMTMFDEMFKVSVLQSTGILDKVIPIHDLSERQFIIEQSYSVFDGTSLKQMLWEDSTDTVYKNINAYMQYFGEQKAMHKTFFDFFNMWLIYPSIFSIILTIYQAVFSYDTQGTAYFTLFVMIWAAIMTEMWKRKQATIAYSWGYNVFELDNLKPRKNPDFVGYPKYDYSKQGVTQSVKHGADYAWRALNILISIVLIAGNFAVYFVIKDAELSPLMTSFFISLSTNFFNYIYLPILTRVIKKENHKFIDKRDDSLIMKQMIFRFINTNLPIFRALSDVMASCGTEEPCTQEEQESQFFTMYTLILGLIITKAGSTFCSRYAYNFVCFKYKMRNHFKNVRNASEAQFANYQIKNKDGKDAWGQMKPQDLAKWSTRNSYSISEGLIMDKASAKALPAKKKGCCGGGSASAPYNRMILNDTKGKEGNYVATNQILIDHIETNGILNEYFYHKTIAKMTDDLIMVSFSMLYAGVCPLATLLVFIYFCITARLEQYQDLNIFSRPAAVQKPTLALWASCIEIIVIFIVILNTLMLYIVSPSFSAALGDIDEILKLILIFGIEHLLIAFLVSLKFGISDIPSNISDKMNMRIRKSKSKGKPLFDEHEEARKIIRDYQEVREVKSTGKLVDFLPFDYREWLEDATSDIIERSLNTNLELKLYHETFVIQERSILHRRMHALCNSPIVLAINCVECRERMAVKEDVDFGDHFCQRCFDRIQEKSEAYKKHVTKQIPLAIEAIPEGEDMPQVTTWKKFEYFNFPVPNTNDHFSQLQIHFEKLKKIYITLNYINYDGQIELGSVFVNQNYDALERKDGRALKQKHVKKYGRVPLLMQKEKVEGTQDFNDEELFYLNRIAYRLLKLKGHKLHFRFFIDDIIKLQCGSFHERISLWLLLVNESEETLQKVSTTGNLNLNNTMITKQKFSNVIRMSYPQDASKNRISYEDIVRNKIFKGTEAKPMDEIIRICETDADAQALMKCVLQQTDDDQ